MTAPALTDSEIESLSNLDGLFDLHPDQDRHQVLIDHLAAIDRTLPEMQTDRGRAVLNVRRAATIAALTNFA